MTIGSLFWFIGAILFIIAGVLLLAKSTFNPLVLVFFGVAAAFLGIAFGGARIANVVRGGPAA